jgi:tetratricopeptide (TPR) repeat protein
MTLHTEKTMRESSQPSLWRRLQAGWWYLYGVGLCQLGLRTINREVYRRAVQAFDRALAAWPDLALALYRRGLIRGRELGEYYAAIRDLEAATRLRPDWPEPYLQRGLFHRFHHHNRAAIPELTTYVRLAPAGFWRTEAERMLACIQAELE